MLINDLNWIDTSTPIIPTKLVATVDNKLYALSHFNEDINSQNIVLDDLCLALNLSISLYYPITLLELVNIAKIVKVYKIPFREVAIFSRKDIISDKTFNNLLLIEQLPDTIKQYLSSKSIPLKSVELLSTFNKNLQIFVSDFFNINPQISYQNAKLFIDNVAINKERLEGITYTQNFKFTDNRSAIHKEIDKRLMDINSKIRPIKISTDDNFESGKLKISYDINSSNSYDYFLSILEKNSKELKDFLGFIRSYDLY